MPNITVAKKQIIVHVGLPKTGTTALQRTLHGSDRAITETPADPSHLREFFDRYHLNHECDVLFLSNEEVIFGGLRPFVSETGVLLIEDWKLRIDSFVSVLMEIFPDREVIFAYSTRDLDGWLISAYAQNFDSHYWLSEISFIEYRRALESQAPEVISILRGDDFGRFERVLESYGQPVRMSVAELFRHLQERGLIEPSVSISRGNIRSRFIDGDRKWVSKPITVGQLLSKFFRVFVSTTGLPCELVQFFDRILRKRPFRNIVVGHYEISKNGMAQFQLSFDLVGQFVNDQPVGLINNYQSRTRQIF